MTQQEEMQITEWNAGLDGDIEIHLVMTEDKRSGELNRFCEDLTRLAPKVSVVNEEGGKEDAPAIKVGDTLCYHAVPLGMELEPFLKALSSPEQKVSGLPGTLLDKLGKLKLPATLRLYVSQQCPVCPLVVPQITPLPAVSEFIELTIIDCTLFPEMAESDKVQSVPTLVLDNQFRWTGPLQLEEVLEIVMDRDPANLSVSSLQRMLEEGNAIEVVEMMLDKKQIFPQFVDLVVHEKWSVRMGAAVAMEEIAERNPELLAQVIDPLWERFDHVEDPIKDDILYIFGKSGSSEVALKLEGILSGQYSPEVKEAAKEALETLAEEEE